MKAVKIKENKTTLTKSNIIDHWYRVTTILKRIPEHLIQCDIKIKPFRNADIIKGMYVYIYLNVIIKYLKQ